MLFTLGVKGLNLVLDEIVVQFSFVDATTNDAFCIIWQAKFFFDIFIFIFLKWNVF